MEILVLFIWLLLGFALIIKGGDWFVDAAVYVAKITGIPSFIIGATIVSLATTLPEVLVSVVASSAGNVDLAIGNAYGSVIANLGLILGISLTVSPPKSGGKGIIQKGLLMIGITIISLVLLKDLVMSGTESIILWVMLVVFLWLNLLQVKDQEDDPVEKMKPINTKKQIILFIVGAIMVVIGAQLLVNSASELAIIFSVPQAVIGLTVVALGTSLPELVTTIMALIKKESGLSVGNIIGANVLNMTLAIPASVIAANNELVTRQETISWDIPFSLWLMAITIFPTLIKRRFYRWQGILLLISYVFYILQTIF